MALPLHNDGTSQHDEVVRLLADAPDGLSDGELTRALADTFTGIRPQTVNQLCRRMVAAGTLARVGSRPIRNRLTVVPTTPSTVDAAAPDGAPLDGARPDGASDVPSLASSASDPTSSATDSEAGAAPSGAVEVPPHPRDRVGEPEHAPGEDVALHASSASDVTSLAPEPPPEPAPEPPPRFDALRAVADGRERPTRTRQPSADDDVDTRDLPPRKSTLNPSSSAPEVSLPAWDALQGWSRTANVTAALADWLHRQGGTIRAASSGAGPAHDLVVRLGADDLHVEITGWPPDGARTHPTTLAADWFTAATRAAEMRRRAHPRARVVIALPDTRRYRSLTEDRAAALAGAGTEVWFVGPGGAVHPG